MPNTVDLHGRVVRLRFEDKSQGVDFADDLMLPSPAGKALPPNVEFAAPPAPVSGAVRIAGAKLSNIAFNLSQHVGEPLSTDRVRSMDESRRQWDAAIHTTQSAPSMRPAASRSATS